MIAMETESESIDIASLKREALQQSQPSQALNLQQNVSGNDRLDPVRLAFQRLLAAGVAEIENTSEVVNAQPHEDVINTQSLPELASTVPDSQAIDEFAIVLQTVPHIDVYNPVKTPKKMSSQTSVPHDTQPVSQSIYESIITRFKTVQDANGTSQNGAEVSITQDTFNEGDEGHIDILSSFKGRAYPAPEDPASEPTDFSPTQTQHYLSHFPESQRYKTPGTVGRKRFYDGQAIESPSFPRNPLARSQGKTPSQIMGLSQAFAATQAASSSPFPNALLSDPLSDRPSPNIEVQTRPPSTSTNSPLQPRSDIRLSANEPYSRYVSMKQSQAQREQLAKIKNTSPDLGFEDSDDDEFDIEPSLVERRRRQREREEKVRHQFEAVRSPTQPRSKGKTGLTSSPSKPLLTAPRTSRKQPIQPYEEVEINHDDGGSEDDAPPGSLSEEETEQEGEIGMPAKQSNQLVQVSEEDKENTENGFVQIPDTTNRIQKFTNGSSHVQASPSIRPTINGNLGDEPNPDASQGQDGSQPFIVANSQPSQPIRRMPQGFQLHLPSSDEDRQRLSRPQYLTDGYNPASSPTRVRESSPKEEDATRNRDGDVVTSRSMYFPPIGLDGPGPAYKVQDKPDEPIGADGIAPGESALSQRQIPHSAITHCVDSVARAEQRRPITTTAQTFTIPETSPSKQSQAPAEVISNIQIGDAESLSNDSTRFDTAKTHPTSSSGDPVYLPSKTSALMASPARTKRRRMTEITTDPSPGGFHEPDMENAMALVDNQDFERMIGSSSPIARGRRLKRRRLNNLHNSEAKAALGQNITPDPQQKKPFLPVTASGRGLEALSEQDEQHFHRSDVEHNGNTSEHAHSAIPDRFDHLVSSDEEDCIRSARRPPKPSLTSEEMWEVQPSPPKPIISRSRTLATKASKLVSGRITEEPRSRISRTIATIGEATTANSNGSPGPVVLGVVADDALQVSGSASTHEVEYPNQVLAFFNGKTRGYFPAKCLGVSSAQTSRFRIQWEGFEPDEVDAHGVRSLDLRVGDSVKIDLPGFPKVSHAIRELKDKIQVAANDSVVTDIRGHQSLLVAPRKRKSLPADLVQAETAAREVPVSAIYLDNNMWNQMRERHFIYTPQAQLGNHPQNGFATPSERPSTPNTPSSRSRRTTVAAPAVSSNLVSVGGIFTNMAFAVTGYDPKRRPYLPSLIRANGGLILEDGFHQLFHNSEPLELESSMETRGFTALIADRHSRKPKFMQALALDLPCLSGRWIRACIAHARLVEWQPYLLAAGESKYLDGAIRSRVLPAIDPATVTLKDMINTRPRILSHSQDTAVLVTASGRRTKPDTYIFLTCAMGVQRLVTVKDLSSATDLLKRNGGAGGIGWVFVGDKDVEAAKAALESTAKGDDSVKVVGKEFICQSLILGALCE